MTTATKWHITTVGGSILIQSEPDVDIAQVFRPYPEATAKFGIKEDSALGKWQTDQQLKNARLIAAAPELLEVCEVMLRDHLATVGILPENVKGGFARQALDAIAKAKGEQS